MAKAFDGKVVLVTGSSNGIGRETAILFAENGAKVTITGRNAEALENVRSAIVATGIGEENVLVIQGNLIDDETQKKLVEDTVAKFGKLDVLVGTGVASRDLFLGE